MTNESTNTKRELVGYALVDSGMLAIADPLNADRVHAARVRMVEGIKRGEVDLNARVLEQGRGANYSDDDSFVVTMPGHGDGAYPVYVETQDGHVVRVTVECDLYGSSEPEVNNN
jgi:Protein of unknown function (DUF4241)